MRDPLLSVTASVDIDIPFQDIDAMEVVWHGNYPRYFEIARCALLDAIDYDYPRMRDSGYAWPVVDMRIKYIRPLTFRQRVCVTAELAEYENRLKINFVIRDALSGEKHCTCYTVQVAVDMQTREMCYVTPPVLREKLVAHLQCQQQLGNESTSDVAV